MQYYRFSIGTGTFHLDTFIVAVDEPTTNYQALTDLLIDKLEEAHYGNLLTLDGAEEQYCSDEFVTGGNHNLALIHYGSFDIKPIDRTEVRKGEPIYSEDELVNFVAEDGEYIIPVVWQMYGSVQITGVNNLREAIDIAYERFNELPLPTNGEYVDDSFEIDKIDDEDFLIAQKYRKFDANFKA